MCLLCPFACRVFLGAILQQSALDLCCVVVGFGIFCLAVFWWKVFGTGGGGGSIFKFFFFKPFS